MSADKYPSIFSRPMKAIVYLLVNMKKEISRILSLRESVLGNISRGKTAEFTLSGADMCRFLGELLTSC